MDAHSLEAGTLVVVHIRGQEAEHGGGVDTVVLVEEAPARAALHTWTRSRSHFSCFSDNLQISAADLSRSRPPRAGRCARPSPAAGSRPPRPWCRTRAGWSAASGTRT